MRAMSGASSGTTGWRVNAIAWRRGGGECAIGRVWVGRMFGGWDGGIMNICWRGCGESS